MEAKLAFLGHALMENYCGLNVEACLTQANGHAEHLAALAMIEKQADVPHAITLGAYQGYDAADLEYELRAHERAPTRRAQQDPAFGRSAIEGRTTRHPATSQASGSRRRSAA